MQQEANDAFVVKTVSSYQDDESSVSYGLSAFRGHFANYIIIRDGKMSQEVA